jgi:cephalosporin hydroxylase
MTLRCKIEPCQDLPELDAFIELVKRENINSYLEIGSRWGGSFWRVMTALPLGSRGVSVDLQPNNDLNQCMITLIQMGYVVRFIPGDSTNSKVVAAAQQGAPYDLCLIDGNHTAPYVRSDWKNYGPMAKIVAFHDINYSRPYLSPTAKWPIDVPKLWKEIKDKYRHEEIKLCHTRRDNGFGILWR